MLKKLFVHEWKAFYKMPALVNISLVVITLIGLLSLLSPIWKTDNPFLLALLIFSFIFYLFALIIGPLIVTALTAVRFYKHIYTDEGYLTHTLPVTPRQLLLSKLFVSSLWMLITLAVVLLSVTALMFGAVAATAGEYSYDFNYGFRMFLDAFMTEFNLNAALLSTYMIVYSLIWILFSSLMIYASISLGQLFSGHKILGSVIWYIGLVTGVQIITSVITNIQLLTNLDSVNIGYSLNASMIISLICSALGCVGFYFISEYVMRKKLNLD